jgi:Uma2 family endonuclease
MGEAGILRDARVELVEGEIIKMSPIGSMHAGTVSRLSRWFNLAVGETAIVSTQNPLILGYHSEPEPDLALLRPRKDFYTSAHPRAADVLLIVEVADSSLRYDREIKIPLYARHGIPEVWLVDLENRKLSLYSKPVDKSYAECETPEQLNAITPQLLPSMCMDMSELF